MAKTTDGKYIGEPMKRVEDRALLLGRGRYVDDFRPPGCLFVAFLRCPHAHARITRLNTAGARSAPGVIGVITGADLDPLGPMNMIVNRAFFPSMKVPPHPLIAKDSVHALGVPVAAVVADSPYDARDAVDLIEVDYEPLPAVTDPEAALREPALFPDLGTNLSFSRTWKNGDPDTAFASAHRVAKLRVVQQRLASVALEPRGTLAHFEPATGELTIWMPSQAPARTRAEVASILGIPETRVRVISPEAGGGFGTRSSLYRETVLVAFLAVHLGRPVKWISTRSEDLATTQHGRGGISEGELAVGADGRITGLRARIVCPLGTSLANSAANSPLNHARLLPGAYTIPACDIEVSGVFTTTAPTGAYRGAGRPEATFLIERLVDEAARALGMDPVDLRRKNLIPPDRFPYKTVTGQTYDSGDYARALDKALAIADYPRLREEQAAARKRGEIVGIGIATYVEPCGSGWESGSVRVERTGAVTAVTGSSATGQGHETTFAQVVADFLGVEPGQVVVKHGDTQGVPQGVGTMGSRSVALGGGALAKAAVEVREKGRRIAANLLEAAVEDVVPVPGGFEVVGVPTRRSRWKQVADAAYKGQSLAPGDTPGLDATVFFQADGEMWSFGAVVAMVEIERETGQVSVEKLVWVDDAGTIINPLLTEGQLHGAFAQGYGQVFLEQIVYDADGQLLTGTLMDYAVARAADMPLPILDKTVTPSPRNPLGAKGVGEGGCIAVPPAIVNAVMDALAPFGVTTLDMPVTPEKVRRALANAP
jgi:carbon-monoxide dehydrogenase large subunit